METSQIPAPSIEVPYGTGPSRRRTGLVVGAIAAAVVIAAAAVAVADPFSSSTPAAAANPDSTSLQPVTQGTLTSQTQVDATLGYSGIYAVLNQSAGDGQSSSSSSSGNESPASGQGSSPTPGQESGIVTALPTVGQVVSQGQSLYSVSGSPVVLLYGATPAYRSLSEGMSGPDVAELNADLVALGYAKSSGLDPGSDYFSPATATALKALQGHLGVTQTGVLALGQAVFLPTAARVTGLSTSLGQPVSSGTPILDATSTARQVVADLDVSQQSDVAVGDKVTITLPNNATTSGVVSSVGTVATCPSGGGSSGSASASGGVCPGSSTGSTSTPTITVDVTPSDPSATGTWDQAPVEVTITTASAPDALIVPVDALLAQAGGSYAVEVAGAGGTDNLVPVTLGLFNDADGLVQVTGAGLQAGQKVVVPNL
jgi:Putative peptidoglycan binding domain/HlyD family secretion protein